MMDEWYPLLKAFHIISMVAWMAGLFYLPRNGEILIHTDEMKSGTRSCSPLGMLE